MLPKKSDLNIEFFYLETLELSHEIDQGGFNLKVAPSQVYNSSFVHRNTQCCFLFNHVMMLCSNYYFFVP